VEHSDFTALQSTAGINTHSVELPFEGALSSRQQKGPINGPSISVITD
jgi:hypothetical protein